MKPNVIILACEQLYARHLGCYGYPLPTSPNLDAFAQRGVRFDRCFAHCPKCTPSRASVVTGQYPATNGYMKLSSKPGLDPPNLIKAFRDQGYYTYLFRKNHQIDDKLMNEVYDEYHPAQSANPRTDEQYTQPGSHPLYRMLYRGEDRVDLTETLDGATARIMKERIAREHDQPYLMWMSFWQTHPAYKCTPEYFRKFDRSEVPLPPHDDDPRKPDWLRELRRNWGADQIGETEWREYVATYAGMVAELDEQIGRIMKAVEQSGQADNTIIALWADHGDFVGAHQLVEKYDTAMYDCLTHVPLILCGPGMPRGAVRDTLIESVDLLPTIADYCGVTLPTEIHGRSCRAAIDSPDVEHRDSVIAQGGYHHHTRHHLDCNIADTNPYAPKVRTLAEHPDSMCQTIMLRTTGWKLIRRAVGPDELYDLQSDPDELRNRYGDDDVQPIQRELEHMLLDRCLDAWPPVSSS